MASFVIPTVDTTADETKVLLTDRAGNNTTSIYRIIATNPNAVDGWIQWFDVAATDDVTLGTTVPDWFTFIPAGDGTNDGAVVEDFYNAPVKFQKGIVYAVTTTVGGSTGPTADGALGVLHR